MIGKQKVAGSECGYSISLQYCTVCVDSAWELTFLTLTHHLFSNARVSVLVCKDLV